LGGAAPNLHCGTAETSGVAAEIQPGALHATKISGFVVWLEEHWRGEAFIPKELLPLVAVWVRFAAWRSSTDAP
jgi:hypothetical protein